jgi:hypothetical protein
MTQAEMIAEIERLKTANAELTARVQAGRKQSTISLKVSEKGGISAYGLGRFPVTLYQEQWTRLLEKSEDIKAFMAANADRLTTKQQAA